MRIDEILTPAQAIAYGNDLFERLADGESREERAECHAWYLHVRELIDDEGARRMFESNPPPRPPGDATVTRPRSVMWHRLNMLHYITGE